MHENLYLQYTIVLAQNGMVDGSGDTGVLPVSERLRRLSQYSSNFRNGIFDYEDFTAHPDHVLQLRNFRRNMMVEAEGSLSTLYGKTGQSTSSLSVFTPGSIQAGIQSHRCLIPVGFPAEPGRLEGFVSAWAIHGAQDLLVIAEVATPDRIWNRLIRYIRVHFCSLSRSKITLTAHPAAMLPCVQVLPPGGSLSLAREPTGYMIQLCISGQHAIWQLVSKHGGVLNHSIEVCNWITGQITKRVDFGTQRANIVPLDDLYLLVTLRGSELCLNIHSFSPSIPNPHKCTLELPYLNTGENLASFQIITSQLPSTREGHFRADPSLSIVVLTRHIQGPEGKYASHLLVPSATLLAQIQAVVSQQGDVIDSWEPPDGPPVLVQNVSRSMSWIPFSSRMPVVAFDGPDAKGASVYVFDINPLAARHARQHILEAALGDESQQQARMMAIVEDVEDVLPGTVDPDCSAIPYVAYRFKLPYSPTEWPHGHRIRSVRMSMTGFTVTFDGTKFEEMEQSWTV